MITRIESLFIACLFEGLLDQPFLSSASSSPERLRWFIMAFEMVFTISKLLCCSAVWNEIRDM
jgi:hypothetical protein